jgi:hypothetical protein
MVQTKEAVGPPTSPVMGRSPRRRRWGIRTAAAIIALLVAFGIFAAVFVSSYQPLQVDAGGVASGVTGSVQNLGSFLPPKGDRPAPFVAYLAPYQDGQVISLGFTVINREWFPVTVQQIGSPGGSPLQQLSVRIGSDPDATAAFTPFKAPSNTGTYVVVRYRFVGCSLNGAGETLMTANMPLTYRAFGVSHRVFLPLPYSIRVFGRGGCS